MWYSITWHLSSLIWYSISIQFEFVTHLWKMKKCSKSTLNQTCYLSSSPANRLVWQAHLQAWMTSSWTCLTIKQFEHICKTNDMSMVRLKLGSIILSSSKWGSSSDRLVLSWVRNEPSSNCIPNSWWIYIFI